MQQRSKFGGLMGFELVSVDAAWLQMHIINLCTLNDDLTFVEATPYSSM
jgi:hypothetical protein